MLQWSVEQALHKAWQLHHAGEFSQAEIHYRQILAQHPDHAQTLHLLGILAFQVRRFDAAAELIGRAVALTPHAPAMQYDWGVALHAAKNPQAAIAAYQKAIALQPAYPEAWCNLGLALQETGAFDAALAAYQQALTLQPDFPQAHYNLGIALKATGQLEAASAAFRQAITLQPAFAEAYNNLGNVLKDLGQLHASINAYRQALAQKADYPEAWNNLAVSLHDQGDFAAAIDACRQALALAPAFPEAHFNLGHALDAAGQAEAAVAACRQALALKPDFPEACNVLGNALKLTGQVDAALAAYQRAVELKPPFAEAWSNLGNALKDVGQVEDAVAAQRRAVSLAPNNAAIHSNLVYTLHFDPRVDAPMLAEELKLWNLRHAQPLAHPIQPHPHDRDPMRRLRVGYVSADFRDHVIGHNMLPLLQHHCHEQFEIVGYSGVASPDTMTYQFRTHCDTWRDISRTSDDALAAMIRQDHIDILVDLTLHLQGSRLLAFARKPAPVQVTFAGYPGSTGMPAMDYRLTDPHLDPPGEGLYAEKSWPLPDSFWCYQPPAEAPPVAALPCLTRGHITFGSLNNFSKVNDPLLRLWGRVLRIVENSRILLLTGPGRHQQRTLDLLQQEGISPERIIFLSPMPRVKYLQAHQQVDVGLDTLPYNGHTTTLDALYMGVPVITLRGHTAVGRGGASILTNVGLPELIAPTPDAYVQIATTLATNLPRLATLRATLREKMHNSPLTNAPRFARAIEQAYRHMWHHWCNQPQSKIKN